MKENSLFKVVGVNRYDGVNRLGKSYTIYTLEVFFEGMNTKIKSFQEASIGDYVSVILGTKKTVYGVELTAIVDNVIPASEVENVEVKGGIY